MNRCSLKTCLSLVVIGILAGITGIVLNLMIHEIQHYAFGWVLSGDVSFREVVVSASPLRRVLVLLACGAIGGIGWVCIHRYGSPLVSIKASVQDPRKLLPFKTTICHGLLQIVTVAMGSPLGREVAPREISVAFAAQWIRMTHPDPKTHKLLIACGAGAGLAAVYNVPLAASLFILETLLLDWGASAVGAAVLCCGTAVYVMRLGLGDLVQYPIPQTDLNSTLMLWAAAAGPVIAFGVSLFEKSLDRVPSFPRKSTKMIWISLLAFGTIGLLSIFFPEILGNGKAGNQLSFSFSIGWEYGLELFIAKWAAIWLAMLAGAYGGRITPSMMLGGMLALILAIAWNAALPVIPVAAAGFVGAAVFLGLAQKMPLTSAVFLLELTRFSPAYLFPVCLCMATAIPVFHYLQKK